MAKKKVNKEEKPQFAVDNKTFEFVAPQVEVNLGSGYKTLTAEELVSTTGTGKDEAYVHADVLIHLVEIGSGVIKVIKGGK